MAKSPKQIAEEELKNGLKVGTAAQVVTAPEPMPSGALSVDYATVIGGVPRGRVVEAFGLESSGKSTFAFQVAAKAQQRGEKIIIADYEHALDEVYCKALGLDTDDEDTFFMMQPDYLEQGANAILRLIDTGEFRLVIFDSVKSMLPAQIDDKDVGEATVGSQANAMSIFLQKLVPKCGKNNTAAIFINHLMNTIPVGGSGGSRISRETTPGGRALKFYSSLRLKFALDTKAKTTSQYDPLTNSYEDLAYAYTGKITVVKNKVGKPGRVAPYTIRYGEGFDNTSTAIDVLVAHGIVSVSGGWHRIPAALDDPNVFDRSDTTKYPNFPGYCRSEAKMYSALRSASYDTQQRWFNLAQMMLERTPEIEVVEDDEDSLTPGILLPDEDPAEAGYEVVRESVETLQIHHEEVQAVLESIPEPSPTEVTLPVGSSEISDLLNPQPQVETQLESDFSFPDDTP